MDNGAYIRESYRYLGFLSWSTRPSANAVPVGTRFTATDRGYSDWVSDGYAWVSIQKERQKSTSSLLAANYAQYSKISEQHGPSSRPRPGATVADDIPVVSSSATIPSSDPTDPVTRRIDIFGGKAYEGWGSNPLTRDDVVASKTYSRGMNENIAIHTTGCGVLCRGSIAKVNQATGAGIVTNLDAGASWGVTPNVAITEVVHDGTVIYFSVRGTTLGFMIEVNGSVIEPSATSGDITVPQYPFLLVTNPDNRWVKVKFPSAKRRRIRLIQTDSYACSAIMCAATDIITGWKPPLRIGFFGDSFTDQTISDNNPKTRGDIWPLVFNGEFGGFFEILNFAVAGSSFSRTEQVLVKTPQSAYADGMLATHRKVLTTCTDGLDLDIVVALVGHNDASVSSLPLFRDEVVAFWKDAKRIHPNAIYVMAGCNPSPSKITDGTALSTEAILKAVANDLGVIFIPIQGGHTPLFTGTGDQGAPNGSGTTDVLTGPDKVHPTVKGNVTLGRYIAYSLVSKLNGI